MMNTPTPQGYKQTEIGVIPEDWEVSSIGKKHVIATGLTPPTSNSKNYGDAFLFVSPADLDDKKYITKTEKHLSEQGFKLARRFPSESTLFTCIGSTIGKTGLAQEELTSNQQINAIFPNNESDSEFTYYALTYIAPKIKVLAGQQAVPLVNKSEFGETIFCFPKSQSEQTAIATALSDVDALISGLESLIAKKQAIKTATMQQLLTGKTRLPQFAHHPDGTPKGTQQTELGEIPEDWGVQLLASNVDFIGSGKTDTKGMGNYNLYGSTGLIGSCARAEYQGEAILIARVGANAGTLNFVSGHYGVSDNTLIVKVSKKNNINYFRYWLLRKNLNSMVFGSGQPLITGGQLKNVLLPVPDYSEQSAIAQILSDMDEEIQTLQTCLSKTQQIKQGMMQELLTGKVRLVKPELQGTQNAC